PPFHASGYGESLHVEPGCTPRSRPTESNALKSQLGHNVILICVFRIPTHGKAGHRDGSSIYQMRVDYAVPRDRPLVGEIVMERAKSGQVDGREPSLSAY